MQDIIFLIIIKSYPFGTIVEILANGAAFEVEFSDKNGQTYESVGLTPEQIMVLHFEPA